MKSIIVKKIREEFGVKKISGKKLELYNIYELVGFYTGQHGGSLVINAAGYGVITITSNLDIYANWKSVEN